MAIALKASSNVGTSNKTSATSVSRAVNVAYSAGDILIALLAKDNTSTTDGDNGEVTSVTDSQGNTYEKLVEQTNGQGSAAAGATISIWKSKLTTGLAATDTVTANFASCAAKVFRIAGFTVGAGKDLTVAGSPVTNVGDGSSPGGETISGLTSKEYLFIGGCALEGNSVSGGTNGMTSLGSAATSGGSGASNMALMPEYRIATDTTSQLFGWGTSGDWAAAILALEETGGAFSITAETGSYALTGTSAALKRGLKVTAASGTYSLTGTAATLSRGKVVTAASGSYTLTGTAATFRKTWRIVGNVGSYTLTGTAAAISRQVKITAASGSYTLTGTAATMSRQVKITAASGTYTLTGTDATLTKSGGNRTLTALPFSAELVTNGTFDTNTTGWTVGSGTVAWQSGGKVRITRSVAPGTAQGIYQTLTDQGLGNVGIATMDVVANPSNIASFIFYNGTSSTLANPTGTGQVQGSARFSGSNDFWFFGIDISAGIIGDYVELDNISVRRVDYLLTGTSAALTKAKLITAASGTYTLTGTAATMSRQVKITAASGSYTLTGTAATMSRQVKITAASGSYTLTGTTAALKRGLKVTAASGAYVITGTAAALKRGLKIAAASGSYALTGTAATFRKTWRIVANTGSYVITGTAANLFRDKRVTADPGTYTITGTAAALKRGLKITAASTTYTLTGTAASFFRGKTIVAASGAYNLTGTAAALKRGLKITAASTTYTLTGATASLKKGWKVVATSGSYTLTGFDAGLSANIVQITHGDVGVYTYTGYSAALGLGQTVTYRLVPSAQYIRTFIKLSPDVRGITSLE